MQRTSVERMARYGSMKAGQPAEMDF